MDFLSTNSNNNNSNNQQSTSSTTNEKTDEEDNELSDPYIKFIEFIKKKVCFLFIFFYKFKN